MVVLHAFAQQQLAIVGRKLERGAVGMGRVVVLLAAAEDLEPRFAAFGLLAVGPAVDFHLQDAQIEPDLNFVAAVVAGNDADGEPIGIVFPAFENGCQVFGHGGGMQ